MNWNGIVIGSAASKQSIILNSMKIDKCNLLEERQLKFNTEKKNVNYRWSSWSWFDSWKKCPKNTWCFAKREEVIFWADMDGALQKVHKAELNHHEFCLRDYSKFKKSNVLSSSSDWLFIVCSHYFFPFPSHKKLRSEKWAGSFVCLNFRAKTDEETQSISKVPLLCTFFVLKPTDIL